MTIQIRYGPACSLTATISVSIPTIVDPNITNIMAHKTPTNKHQKVDAITYSLKSLKSLAPFDSPTNVSAVNAKPSIKKAPSNNAVIGRYILPLSIFKKLAKQTKNQGGEIHITDSIQSLIKDNHKFIGHNFAGKYLDCGTMEGYIQSTVDISKL